MKWRPEYGWIEEVAWAEPLFNPRTVDPCDIDMEWSGMPLRHRSGHIHELTTRSEIWDTKFVTKGGKNRLLKLVETENWNRGRPRKTLARQTSPNPSQAAWIKLT